MFLEFALDRRKNTGKLAQEQFFKQTLIHKI